MEVPMSHDHLDRLSFGPFMQGAKKITRGGSASCGAHTDKVHSFKLNTSLSHRKCRKVQESDLKASGTIVVRSLRCLRFAHLTPGLV